MKKTLKIIAILAIVMFFVTGCAMKSNVGLEVAKNKKVTVKVVEAMDDEMIDYYLSMANGDSEGTTYTDEQRWEYIESSSSEENDEEYAGYSKEKYSDDKYKGYVYSKELGDIDDLVAENSESVSLDNLSSDSKIFTKDGDTYNLKLTFDPSNTEEAQSYQDYGVEFDLTFFVTLPNKAIENNATSVSDDGKTYTWDLLKANDANLSFKLGGGLFGSSSNVLPIVLGCVAGVVVVAVIVVVVIKVSKKGKKPEGGNTEN